MSTNSLIEYISKKIKDYKSNQIIFTKIKLIDWLCKRNSTTLEEMKNELLNGKNLVHVVKQEVVYLNQKEERFQCYFVYSKTKGRCYILKFEEVIKVITVFPLGRTTLKRYTRKFK